MENIIVLNIKYQFGGVTDYIHPVILKDDYETVLVDCGYIGYLPEIEKALEQVNLSCSMITKVVITHQDHDHMGSLAELKRKYPGVKVVASEEEAPYISGKKKFLRLEQAEDLQATLPKEQKDYGKAFCDILKSVEPVPVDIIVHDKDTFDWCGGCMIIATSGHTPGHISLYLEKHNTVITGDAAVIENHQLAIANPQFTLDMEGAEKSLHKIINLPVTNFICYHGGSYDRGTL